MTNDTSTLFLFQSKIKFNSSSFPTTYTESKYMTHDIKTKKKILFVDHRENSNCKNSNRPKQKSHSEILKIKSNNIHY